MSLSNTLTPLPNQAKNQFPPSPKALQVTLPALPVGCTSRIHLSPTLPSYPYYFCPAPTIFPVEAPKVALEADSFSAAFSGFSLPYKQSTPVPGLRVLMCVPSWGRSRSSERRDRAWCLAQRPSFRRALQGGDQLCHVSCRMSLVSQEEPARALRQDCAMLSAELGGKSLGK